MIRKLFGLIINAGYDAWRFWRYASNHRIGGRTQSQRLAAISASYHTVEKGLAMPEPRAGYGRDNIVRLMGLIHDYQQGGYDAKQIPYRSALSALRSYLAFHDELQHDLGPLRQQIERCLSFEPCDDEVGGSIECSHRDVHLAARGDFASVARSRHSTRNFTDKPVPLDVVMEAVRIAQKTPTVCNRQSFRVHVSSSEEVKSQMLRHQIGNRGFGHTANRVLIVTTDLQCFFASSERNQSYVDGGLFSMSLMYALHYLGVASCPLNWCANFVRDRKLHQAFSIPFNENVIMFIAIGYPPERYRVPKSSRLPVESVVRLV